WTYTFDVPSDHEGNATETVAGPNVAGNANAGSDTIVYIIDNTAPNVSGVAISATGVQNDFVNAGDVVSVTATFSEVVNKTGTPQLTLAVGSNNRTANYASGTGSAPLVFQYTIQAGDNDTNGISIGTNVLALNSGTISDPAGNNATLTHSSVDNNSGYKVDAILPTIDSVEIDNATTGMLNNFLNASDAAGSDVVSATVTFSELVDVTGTPQLTLAIGSDNEAANYASGTGSRPLVFQYTIQAGDNDTDGISFGANAIDLDNGTISDPAGNNATLDHDPVPSNPSYMVDTEAPRVNNFTLDNETVIDDLVLLIGETATVNLVFSEAVRLFDHNDVTAPTGVLPTSPATEMSTRDNISWNGTFTPTNGVEVPTNTLSLRGATNYTDLAGNNGPSATFSSYEVDTIAPTGTFTLSDRFLRVTDNSTVPLV
ncbi:MAG: Ig-like domain-containing protein, partial [Pseudomonadales bacterium]|nr:Ig-like domain-containing protein [Pseudomonadales bacterium]